MLVRHRRKGTVSKEILVLADYFSRGGNNDDFMLTYDMYVGLIKFKGIYAGELGLVMVNGKLNVLIRTKHKHRKSDIYKKFCERKIVVGCDVIYLCADEDGKYLIDEDDNCITKYTLLDDNHCTSCKENNYITENYPDDSSADCYKCYNFICKKCSKRNKNGIRYCKKC